MKLYLAMWARGVKGNDVLPEEMEQNKQYAVNAANRIRSVLPDGYKVVCPHEDEILGFIDQKWLESRDPEWVKEAMDRCYSLLGKCDGMIVFDRGFLSGGIVNESVYADTKNIPIFSDYDDLTDEALEDLVLWIMDVEAMNEVNQ